MDQSLGSSSVPDLFAPRAGVQDHRQGFHQTGPWLDECSMVWDLSGVALRSGVAVGHVR